MTLAAIATAHFDHLLPFHVGFDIELRVHRLGAALQRLLGDEVLGRGMIDLFCFERPQLDSPDLEQLRSHTQAAVVLAVRDSELRLRGELLDHANGLLFVGAPWLTELSQIARIGLHADDFARHDASAELLAINDRLRAEAAERERTVLELQARLGVLEAQQQQLRSLSIPIIKVWDGVLAVPIIGSLDGERSDVLMERLLDAIAQGQVRHAILDVTGVDELDTATADQFMRMARAIRLLGAQAVLCGVGPLVAQTLAELGADLGGELMTFSTLRDALAGCLRARKS